MLLDEKIVIGYWLNRPIRWDIASNIELWYDIQKFNSSYYQYYFTKSELQDWERVDALYQLKDNKEDKQKTVKDKIGENSS